MKKKNIVHEPDRRLSSRIAIDIWDWLELKYGNKSKICEEYETVILLVMGSFKIQNEKTVRTIGGMYVSEWDGKDE